MVIAVTAIAIGGTVGLEALFAGPISGASMNPVRSLAPARGIACRPEARGGKPTALTSRSLLNPARE
ncbi:hypothetical protein NITHO_1730001 [Nitrolancea hollandica Lb]|uniref:Major intrinsic protein n=1 Tax=Nitrolancea hollandica Lb TaxID=1129897 RepID=I4EE62_9BACT|nr:hypothetical protein NITHO_1730001 [Nitrolancea hollandica Lb]